jgi:phage terminase Nu1 subunit (DNA packaging protein)
VHGYVRHLRRGGSVYLEERARFTKVKADTAALAHRVRSGELVPAAEVAETWVALVSVMRTRLLAIPSRVAARWGMVQSTVEAAAMMREEVHEALSVLSKGTVESTRPLQISHVIAMSGPDEAAE